MPRERVLPGARGACALLADPTKPPYDNIIVAGGQRNFSAGAAFLMPEKRLPCFLVVSGGKEMAVGAAIT
jgi:hypothetical protein